MLLFFFAINTFPIMKGEYERRDLMDKKELNVLEKALEAQIKELDELEFGSEEYERAANGIARMTEANASDKKANSDAKLKAFEKVATVITATAAIATAGFKGLEVLLKRKTNKDVLKVEETDYVNSKAFDNR